jgi:hypothetical protein
MVSQCQCDILEKKFDCRDIFHHEYAFSSLASKDVNTVLMPPKEFLLTTYREVMNRNLQAKPPTWQPYEYYIRSVLQRDSIANIKKNMGNLIKGKPDEHIPMLQEEGFPHRKFPIPFLTFDENGEPIGHEGRHTAKAAEELGIKAIPVTIEKPKGISTRRFAGAKFEEYCEQYGRR